MSRDRVEPAVVGVDPRRLDVLLRRARLEVEEGALPSCQVAVAREGRLVAFETFGEANPETRYVLQSAGRVILASAIWKLIGEGALALDAKVAAIIPEFGTSGKDAVTLRHVLTHTAGFPFAPLGFPRMLDRRLRLEAFARWRLDSEPGKVLEWHHTSAAWVLAELVERISGRVLRDYLREEITQPLGLASIEIAVPVERQETIARFVRTDGGGAAFEVDPWGPWYCSKPEILAAGEPSHSMVANAADLALHYQALFHSGLWDAETIRQATRIQVSQTPESAGTYGGPTLPVHMGLFCVLTGPTGGNWMPTGCSPETFGHAGAAYQLGFMDPTVGLSFAFLTNGYPAAGFDRSRRGSARMVALANLGMDLL